MPTRKFKTETLRELIWEEEFDGFKLIETEMFDTSRWSIHYNMIFSYEDKFYQTQYSTGATESQDESPFEYDGPEIDCVEVKPVERTVIKYVAV